MRQIVLDTETTGLEPRQGHRIIEIGCVELVNRRLSDNRYHQYLQPDRDIDAGAIEVHGITNEFLLNKPHFADIAEAFLAFIKGAELIIHNAAFDIGFIDHEFAKLDGEWGCTHDHCTVLDTLKLARERHPGQKNTLDALCKRYGVDNTQRELHGALLDAEILADVYLAMTGGQTRLSLDGNTSSADGPHQESVRRVDPNRSALRVIRPTDEELVAHEARLALIDKASDGRCVWKKATS